MLDLANAALQADDIYYHEYSYEASDPHERLGRSEVDAVGGLGRLDRDELEGHFDYAAYGRDRTGDFFTGPNGYMLAASLPDFERCSRKELAVDIEARWNEAHGIEASTSEPLQPALSKAPGRRRRPNALMRRVPAIRGARRKVTTCPTTEQMTSI